MKRRRTSLKHLFRQGALPTADNFSDFIDSTVNQVDDGFDKSPERGLEISSLGNHLGLVSFFRENLSGEALWEISYDERGEKLLFKRVNKENTAEGVGKAEANECTVLALAEDGRVGINLNDPRHALDVGGIVRSRGRIGVARRDLRVPADGKWHCITKELTGCNAFEVIAGVGMEKTGRYALIHAIAMNAYNPTGFLFNFFKRKNRIRCQHAHYSARGDKLQLQWVGSDRKYRLQLRSRCAYGENGKDAQGNDILVRYYISKLWFDEGMKECSTAGDTDDQLGGADV